MMEDGLYLAFGMGCLWPAREWLVSGLLDDGLRDIEISGYRV
mgnify:CR=1 FL=1